MAKETVTYLTPPFIAAFTPGVWEAQPGLDGGKPKHGVTAIWDKDAFFKAPLGKAIVKALDEAVRAKFKVPFDLQKMQDAGLKTGLRKGESKPDLEGFGPGKIFASLTSLYAPGVVDVRRQEVSRSAGNDELLYPGCLCRAKVTVYTYANKGKGVALGLQSLQILVSDEDKYPRLDNRSNAAGDYEDAPVESDWLDGQEESLGGGAFDDDIPF